MSTKRWKNPSWRQALHDDFLGAEAEWWEEWHKKISRSLKSES